MCQALAANHSTSPTSGRNMCFLILLRLKKAWVEWHASLLSKALFTNVKTGAGNVPDHGHPVGLIPRVWMTVRWSRHPSPPAVDTCMRKWTCFKLLRFGDCSYGISQESWITQYMCILFHFNKTEVSVLPFLHFIWSEKVDGVSKTTPLETLLYFV